MDKSVLDNGALLKTAKESLDKLVNSTIIKTQAMAKSLSMWKEVNQDYIVSSQERYKILKSYYDSNDINMASTGHTQLPGVQTQISMPDTHQLKQDQDKQAQLNDLIEESKNQKILINKMLAEDFQSIVDNYQKITSISEALNDQIDIMNLDIEH